jgi:hypothetical protein
VEVQLMPRVMVLEIALYILAVFSSFLISSALSAKELSECLQEIRPARSFVAELIMTSEQNNLGKLPATYAENVQKQTLEEMHQATKDSRKNNPALNSILNSVELHIDSASALKEDRDKLLKLEEACGKPD